MNKITVDKALLEQAMRAIFPVMEYGLPGTKDTQQHALQKVYAGLTAALEEPAVEPVAEVAWSKDTGYEYKLKMLVEMNSKEGVPVKLYAEPYKAGALYWHDTEADKPANPPPAEHSCKWPTCQTEEYQQDLADQLARKLIGTPPAEVATLPIKNAPARTGVFAYIDAEVRKDMSGFYEALNRPQPPAPADVPMLTNEEFESIRKTCAYQFAEACRSGTTKSKTIMQATEAAVRKKAGLK